MPRRKESGLDLIASLPWPIGLAVGVLAFASIRYIGPALLSSSGNPILQNFGQAASSGALAPLAWLILFACWGAAGISFFRARHRRQLLDVQESLESVTALSWQEFELLVGEAFRRQGYQVEEMGGGGPDGGVDLILRKAGRTELVQCKQWRTRQIKVPVVREMWGLAAHHRAHGVKIVCVGEYTADAAKFAQEKPIELINGERLLALVRSVQSCNLGSSSVAAVRDDSSAHGCPKCGGTMVRRENRKNGLTFWGCVAYPRCRGTREAG